jgi:hypothetical protein
MPLRATDFHDIPVISPTAPPVGISLEFERQEEINWCWAACAEMILKHFHRSNDEQCQIAQKGLAFIGVNVPCCTDSLHSNGDIRCDRTLGDKNISRLWREAYGVQVNYTNRQDLHINDEPALIERLKEIIENHPIQLGYSGSPAGHVIIVYAWEPASSGKVNFLCRDPARGANAVIPESSIIRPGRGTLNALWEILLT